MSRLIYNNVEIYTVIGKGVSEPIKSIKLVYTDTTGKQHQAAELLRIDENMNKKRWIHLLKKAINLIEGRNNAT